MFAFLTRRAALVGVLLAAVGLAGCGDKEPEQRKAFIEFLQKRVIDNRTIANPVLTEKERDAVGPYAAHYQVILDFHSGMDDVVNPLKDNSLNQKLGSMSGLQNNWKEIGNARVTLGKLPEAMDIQVEKAKTARAALKQPDDLKTVYDQAFDKKVVITADIIRKYLAMQDQALLSAEELGRFLDENKDKFTLTGATIQVNDQSVFPKIQAMQKKYNDNARAMMAARQSVMTNR